MPDRTHLCPDGEAPPIEGTPLLDALAALMGELIGAIAAAEPSEVLPHDAVTVTVRGILGHKRAVTLYDKGLLSIFVDDDLSPMHRLYFLLGQLMEHGSDIAWVTGRPSDGPALSRRSQRGAPR